MSDQASQRTRLQAVLRFVDLATDALAAAREEIDALNVYPVPDGDTGTNMFLTVSAAQDGIREATGGDPEADLGAALAALGRSALLGARGNSGVILSQMLGAVASRLARASPQERGAALVAAAFQEATEASYAAVADPVEGTILTVARAASDAAVAAADGQARGRDVFTAAAAAAREALARTPEQLDRLARAGVVDAGGRGLSVLLDAAETAITGRTVVAAPAAGQRHIPVPVPTNGDLTPEGPAYEVMYLLDAPDDAVAALREVLAGLGDSLVVVGREGLWHVHVHVDDVGAALEAGLEAGRPYRVRVTHFAEQVSGGGREHRRVPRGRGVVAVAAGPGLSRLFTQAGATVVEAAPGRRASTGELLQAIQGCGGQEVVVLPNDPDTVRTAEVAARTAEESGELRVAVIPTHAQVQGVAAIAVHEPGRDFDADVLEMTATARHARHGAVTIAARQAITMGGPCEPGDALGVIEGDFAVVGSGLAEVAREVTERLLGGGGELVTVVSGDADGAEQLASALAAHLGSEHPTVDVVVHEGGQQRYPLLLAVE